ncbi:RNase H domain-containing protein [Trichonephila clavipes]|nr:RNase H domain-containing protein [Trichonephila clavipes]
MVSFNLTIGDVEHHHLSQCLDPAVDLDGVFFHPELPVHVKKQAGLPAYLKQLALERIGYIPIDALQVYTDGSRDDYYRSGRRIYIKSQDHILRIQRRNPDGCSVFRSELIAIDEALGSDASLPNEKEIWILSDSRSAIQQLSNWQNVRDNVGVSILIKLKRLFTSHQIHLPWIPSHIDLEGNEIEDTLAKAGACEVPESSSPLAFFEIFSRTKYQNKTAWITPIRPPRVSLPATPAHILECLGLTKQDFSRRSLAGVGLSESIRCHGPGIALLTNGGVQQQQQQQQ